MKRIAELSQPETRESIEVAVPNFQWIPTFAGMTLNSYRLRLLNKAILFYLGAVKTFFNSKHNSFGIQTATC